MLNETIENRAIELMIDGMDAIEAVKKAIDEQNALILELIESKTERAKKVKNQMCKNVYALIHLNNAMS